MTAIQELIKYLKNDRMQNVYTGEQIIELLEFKLEKEKQQIIEAHGSKLRKSGGVTNYEYWYTGEDYYKEKYNK